MSQKLFWDRQNFGEIFTCPEFFILQLDTMSVFSESTFNVHSWQAKTAWLQLSMRICCHIFKCDRQINCSIVFWRLCCHSNVFNCDSTFSLSYWSMWVAFRVAASLSLQGGQDDNISSIFLHFLENSLIFPENFLHFLPHFGLPSGWIAHWGKPWLCHWLLYCVVYSYSKCKLHSKRTENVFLRSTFRAKLCPPHF